MNCLYYSVYTFTFTLKKYKEFVFSVTENAIINTIISFSHHLYTLNCVIPCLLENFGKQQLTSLEGIRTS